MSSNIIFIKKLLNNNRFNLVVILITKVNFDLMTVGIFQKQPSISQKRSLAKWKKIVKYGNNFINMS